MYKTHTISVYSIMFINACHAMPYKHHTIK